MTASMTIAPHKTVYLTYTILDPEGQVLERSASPLGYVHGVGGRLHDKIEAALSGKREGDQVEVALEGDEGFGPRDPALTFTDELANVPPQFHYIGAEVEMQNGDGERRTFVVARIEDGKLTLDGNHPFAGKSVIFQVQVAAVRDATARERSTGEAEEMGVH